MKAIYASERLFTSKVLFKVDSLRDMYYMMTNSTEVSRSVPMPPGGPFEEDERGGAERLSQGRG